MFYLRPAQPQDARELAAFGERAFRETFGRDNTPEDMALYVAETFGEEKQAREITDPARRIVLALAGEALIGFYQLHVAPPDPAVTGPRPIELLRLYVDTPWHGKGVSQSLMADALGKARAEGYATLWLGVWERNFRAQRFYRKWGFAEVGAHVFQLGGDSQRDLIYCRDIGVG